MTSRARVRASAAAVGGFALFVAFVLPELISAIETALHFAGPPIDGPFQLWNALRRIDAGQRPGADFQFFHGVGVPYAHYWLYRLFGGHTLAASELARQVMSALVFPVSTVLFVRAFESRWARVWFVSAAVMGAVFALKLYPLLFALNSIVALRSTLPVLTAAVMYRAKRRATRILGIGAMLGLSLFVSTEQGLAVMAAFVIVALTSFFSHRSERARAVDDMLTVACAALTLVIALAVVSRGRGIGGALAYNFRSVPMDQYWFFGAPPNPFITSWTALPGMLASIPMVAVAIVLGIAASVYYLRESTRLPSAMARAKALLAVYGLVSCASLLGVFVPAYADACWRALLLIGALELLTRARSDDAVRVPRLLSGIAVAAAVCALVFSRTVRVTWFSSTPHFLAAHVAGDQGFRAEGIWPQTLAVDDSIIAAAHSRGDSLRTWSTYAGWFEARAGVFQPSFDYIIHPLGPRNRASYLEAFARRQPNLVQTIRPEYSQYELWIENTSWDINRRLLTSYAISATTPWSFFWQPRAESTPPVVLGGSAIPPGATDIPLPPVPASMDGVVVIEVQLDYAVRNPLGWLPIVGPMPRYLVGVEGARTPMPITLDPYSRRARFPLFARPGDRPVLRLRTFSLLPGASIQPTAVQISLVTVGPQNRAWLTEMGGRFGF